MEFVESWIQLDTISKGKSLKLYVNYNLLFKNVSIDRKVPDLERKISYKSFISALLV